MKLFTKSKLNFFKKLTAVTMATITTIISSACINVAQGIAQNTSTPIQSKGYKKYLKAIVPTAIILSSVPIILKGISYSQFKQFEYGKGENFDSESWFEALGGTQKDIDSYTDLNKRQKQQNTDIITKSYLQTIDADIPREVGRNVKMFCSGDISTEKLLGRILKNSVLEKSPVPYYQGFSSIALIVIFKFLKPEDYKKSNLEDKEAKIYYVYKTLISNMLAGREDTTEAVEKLLEDTNEHCRRHLKHQHRLIVRDNLLLKNFVFKCYITCFTRELKVPYALRFLDCLILANKSPNKTFLLKSKFTALLLSEILNSHNINENTVNDEINKFRKQLNDETFNKLLRKTFF